MLNSTYGAGYFWHDGVRCNQIDSWVCAQVPCDKPYLQPGEHYGQSKDKFNFVLVSDLLLIIFAFGVNHINYMRRNNYL